MLMRDENIAFQNANKINNDRRRNTKKILKKL